MNKWTKVLGVVAATAMLIPLAACGGSRGTTTAGGNGGSSDTVKVGISMPEQMLERWKIDGENLKKQLDRLIMNTDAVDYYATFSLEDVGKMQGEYIEQKLGLKDGKKGPFNVELMAGSPTDNNAGYYFKGAWDVLGPYFKSGVLQSKSGKVPSSADDWQSIGIDNWDRQKAQNEMENRINSFYNDGTKLDAVLAQNDAEATGTYNTVEAAGWDYYPIITGQDAEKANVQAIVQGKQSMTVYKDTRELAKATAEMIKDMVDGKDPKAPDTFNNGTKDVPSQLLTPVTVDKDNLKEILVDGGYISAKDAGL